jgi:hypothetical protein
VTDEPQATEANFARPGFIYQHNTLFGLLLADPASEHEAPAAHTSEEVCFHLRSSAKSAEHFSPQALRKAIATMFGNFLKTPSQPHRLLCHFSDRESGTWQPTAREVLEIWDEYQTVSADVQDLARFAQRLTIEFREDFERELQMVLEQIRHHFGHEHQAQAAHTHGMMNAYVQWHHPTDEPISLQKIEDYWAKNGVTTVFRGYDEWLSESTYQRWVQQTYLRPKLADLGTKERLFVVDCDDEIRIPELTQLCLTLSEQLFRDQQSPAPFVWFSGITGRRLFELKNHLFDQLYPRGRRFNDGTHFDGCRFRLPTLLGPEARYNAQLRVIKQQEAFCSELRDQLTEIYHFFLEEPLPLRGDHSQQTSVQIAKTRDALQIIQLSFLTNSTI